MMYGKPFQLSAIMVIVIPESPAYPKASLSVSTKLDIPFLISSQSDQLETHFRSLATVKALMKKKNAVVPSNMTYESWSAKARLE